MKLFLTNFSMRLISIPNLDCNTCYGLSNKIRPNHSQSNGIFFPAEESTNAAEVKKSVLQFENELAEKDRRNELEQEKGKGKHQIVMDKDMEKYFKPKQQKAVVRTDLLHKGVHRGRLWGL